MSKLKQIFSYIILSISIIVGLGTIASAYSGHINPNTLPIASVMCMTFPYWIVLSLAMLPICFFTKKLYTFVPLLTLIACIGPILNYCPLNISSSDRNGANSFSLLSYNAYNFIAFDKIYPDDETNATLSYIANIDADIVCLQECEYLSPLPQWHVYREQVNAIKKQYPHRIIGVDNGQSIFSKFPVKEITSTDYYSHFVVKMPNGKQIDFIDVHLKSIPLTHKDKQNYKNTISDISNHNDDDNISSIKKIITKISQAAKQRANQAQKLHKYIESIDNDNIIVCGDFNDVPGCYAINTIANDDFDDVYAECGFGPTNTYHAYNINFRIDHILYKGEIEATHIRRGNIDRSDHFPLYAVFKWDND